MRRFGYAGGMELSVTNAIDLLAFCVAWVALSLAVVARNWGNLCWAVLAMILYARILWG
jgi:hypothetical protein